MADLLFLAVMAAMLGLSVAFIRACDLIIGSDDDVIVAPSLDTYDDEMAA